MKSFVILLMIVFYLSVASSRTLEESDVKDNGDLEFEHGRDHTGQMRHRRKSRQSFYYPPFYYQDRRDYDDRRDYYNRNQEELLSRILNQLEEITNYIKRPATPPPPTTPPTPQIIYIPFPYPVPQSSFSSIKPNKGGNVTFPVRWPEMDDENQNWGLVVNEPENVPIDIGDGSRPINLKPVEPEEPMDVVAPEVEHGSVQAGMTQTTTTTARPPSKSSVGRCKAAILVCCQQANNRDRQECFTRYGCPKTYSTGVTCLPEVVKLVLDEFAETYAPVNSA